MTLDPVLAASVLRRGADALSGYTLTSIEQERLIAVVHQRGMSVNCTLARANRFAPIADYGCGAVFICAFLNREQFANELIVGLILPE